jgi:hypothetical protein
MVHIEVWLAESANMTIGIEFPNRRDSWYGGLIVVIRLTVSLIAIVMESQ